MIHRRNFLVGAAALAVSSPSRVHARSAVTPSATAEPKRIPVAVRTISSFQSGDPARHQFGELAFRGGLALTSTASEFGGLSGLHLFDNGTRFVAISDKGNWFQGRLIYVRDELADVTDVICAPILGADGRAIVSRGVFDTESLAIDGDIAYVGIERQHQILRFDFKNQDLTARGAPIALPAGMPKLPFNGGFEAMAIMPKGLPLEGTLVVITERALDASGNIRGWMFARQTGSRPPATAAFTVRRTDDYDISDATILPNGDLILLERKFGWMKGVGIRLRRVAHGGLAAGAVLDGPVLMEVDLGYEIDNFEGIDSHVNAAGETILTLVSDDNFSMIQRTLLMQFALIQ